MRSTSTSKLIVTALLSVAAAAPFAFAQAPAQAPAPAPKAPAPVAAPKAPAPVVAPKPATSAVAPAAPKAAPTVGAAVNVNVPRAAPVVPGAKPIAPVAEVKPIEGPYTLAQATQGLIGNAPLRATIDVEKEGKPLGQLRCELFADKTPFTVANFVGLVRGIRPLKDPRGEKWLKKPLLDGSQFHRVIPDFMIQTGDPQCIADLYCNGRPGTGDPGYAIPDEIRDDLRFDRPGRMGMALRGAAGTAGSQFFITDKDTPWLSGNHTVFGQCEPAALIHTIASVETVALDAPKVPVQIKRVTVSRQQPLANNK